MADDDRFLSLEERRARGLRRQRMSDASQRSKSDFGDMPGGFTSGGSRYENFIETSDSEDPDLNKLNEAVEHAKAFRRQGESFRRNQIAENSLESKSDFGDLPGNFSSVEESKGGPRINSSSYEGPAAKTSKPIARQHKRLFRSSSSDADRLMDIYNKQGGASSSDIESAYRSINPTMKKGGKVASKKASKPVSKSSKPKAMKYARGGGIESRGKTRGRFV